jgi:oligopeptide transport system substrate-binding protein
VQLNRPVAYFLDLCSFYALLPVPRQAIEAHGDAWIRPENIVSNGAYTLEQWQINRRMRLIRNPRYWNADRVELEVVDVYPGDFANGNFNRYSSGLLDWVDSGGIPPSIVDELRERDDWHVGPFLATYFLRFNLRRPPFDDARVRRALFHAVDAEAICRYVTRAGEEAAHSLVPPGLPGYEEVRLGGHDPALARDLLAEAGYPGGEGFPSRTLLFNTSESHRQIAEVLQQQWKEVLGIDVKLQNQEWRVFNTTVQAGDYDLSRGSWIGDYLDPNTFLEIWTSESRNNRTGFARADYDSLIARAARTLDAEERLATLRRCEEIVTVEECVILPIHYYVTKNLYDASRWSGLEPDLVNHVDLKHVRRREGGR